MDKFAQADKNIVQIGRAIPSNDASKTINNLRKNLAYGGGVKVGLEREVLCIFAKTQYAALPVSLILIIGTAIATYFYINLVAVAVWASVQLATYSLMLRFCRKFLNLQNAEISTKKWRARFTLISFIMGLGWAGIIGYCWYLGPQEATNAMFFGLVLIHMATSVQIGSTVRFVPLASTLPPSTLLCIQLLQQPGITSLVMASIIPGALLFVTAIASKLRGSFERDLAAKADKDSMIADLEMARTMSETARNQAEEANLAKSRFLAAMSHELRTPLNAILGFSEVMSKEYLGPMENENYRDYANDIHSSGTHLLSLINEILDLSRIEAGRYELHEEMVILADIAADAQHMIELKTESKNITLNSVIQPNLPRVLADEKAIRQIFLNLLSNAVKFTPKGGAVTLKVGWTQSGGQYFSITDNGPGIPEDEIAIVLSPFGQGSIAINSAEDGTGLGLPIVRAMVDLHDGQFDLTSKLREGTIVTVKLPAERVMHEMPAYKQNEGHETRANKGNRALNVSATPSSQTDLPAQELATRKREVSTDDAVLERMNRLLKK